MIVTLLTPTYNRADTLGQLYHSLCIQAEKDFEWIVVDDGSTDHTRQLIDRWRREADFEIQYIKQENGGKHRALNRGIPMARAPYIYILDSDDYLTDEAISKIKKWTDDIRNIPRCAGVSGTRIDAKGNTIGQYPSGKCYIDAPNTKRRQEKLEGDKAEVYRTDILKKYPFPEFEGEKFLSECAVWDRIGMDGFFLRWYPEALCVCEYREDGLTKAEDKEIANYKGYTFVIKQQLQFEPLLKQLALIDQYDRITRKNGGGCSGHL